MKNNTKMILSIVAVLVIVVGAILYSYKTSGPVATLQPADSITGCYVAHLAKDVYTLNVQTESSGSFTGSLAFQNFEKDSSNGTFNGQYQNGILLGEYNFSSEGMQSLRQVIFKRSGADFIEGFGDYDSTGENFKDPSTIEFNGPTFVLTPTCS